MKIDGVTVKDPSIEGISTTDEPVWSSDTGRNIEDATMIGDIVGIKATVECKWNLLTFQEAYLIRSTLLNAIRTKNGFFDIVYPEVNAQGNIVNTTLKVYCGSIPRKLYSTNPKAQFYKDVTITFIEQ